MKIEEEISIPFDFPNIINYTEAEQYAESIKQFEIYEVGSSQWLQQHHKIEKLNIQAHHSAMANSDEYVLESILTFQKMDILIHNLIVIEAWKEFVYPKLLEKIAGRNSIRTYFILYHEATLINFFEILLYHKHVVSELGEKIIELIDYVARKLIRLSSGYDFRSLNILDSKSSSTQTTAELAKTLESRNPTQELMQHFDEIEYRVCISCCSIARFLCEHADSMSLSAVSRIADTHDYLMLLLPLIENPPWTRRTAQGQWEKLIDHKWQFIQPINLLKLTKLEGQPWLAVYHLLAKKEFRERYHLNTFRKSQLLRLRKYLNEVLTDQLPILTDIQRYMDELSMMEVPEPTSFPSSVSGGAFLFHQVARVREGIIRAATATTGGSAFSNSSSISASNSSSSISGSSSSSGAVDSDNTITKSCNNKSDNSSTPVILDGWERIAIQQMAIIFTMTDATDKDLKQMAELYSDDLSENVLDPPS